MLPVHPALHDAPGSLARPTDPRFRLTKFPWIPILFSSFDPAKLAHWQNASEIVLFCFAKAARAPLRAIPQPSTNAQPSQAPARAVRQKKTLTAQLVESSTASLPRRRATKVFRTYKLCI